MNYCWNGKCSFLNGMHQLLYNISMELSYNLSNQQNNQEHIIIIKYFTLKSAVVFTTQIFKSPALI
jgi:hypothetical protein